MPYRQITNFVDMNHWFNKNDTRVKLLQTESNRQVIHLNILVLKLKRIWFVTIMHHTCLHAYDIHNVLYLHISWDNTQGVFYSLWEVNLYFNQDIHLFKMLLSDLNICKNLCKRYQFGIRTSTYRLTMSSHLHVISLSLWMISVLNKLIK